MKKVVAVAGSCAVIALVATMIKWDYIVHFLGVVTDAATQLVKEGNVSAEIKQEMDDLSVGSFIDIPFFDEYAQEKNITDENGEVITLEKTIESILEE